MILRCLEHSEREFGKEYSTSTTRVKKNDLVDLATYVKESNQNEQQKGENKKVAHAGPNKDTEAKNHSGGEDKVCCRLQAQKQTTVPPKQYRSSNKNGKHRNAKRRRKAEIARNRTHNKRTDLYVLTQDKKAEAKEGGYRKPANDTKQTRQSSCICTPANNRATQNSPLGTNPPTHRKSQNSKPSKQNQHTT